MQKLLAVTVLLAASSVAVAQTNNPRDTPQPSTMTQAPKGPLAKPIRLDSPEGRKLLSGCILRPDPPVCAPLENVEGPAELTVSWKNRKGETITIVITKRQPS